MNELQLAIESIKIAVSIAKGLGELKLGNVVEEKVSELKNIIFVLQDRITLIRTQYEELYNNHITLKKEHLKLTDWESNKPKYERVRLNTGSFAYTIKENTNLTADYPYYCQNCYDNSQKLSIYQPIERYSEGMESIEHSCPICLNNIFIPNSKYKPYNHPSSGSEDFMAR
ncbi:MAG: hypothetical protein WCA84_16440 [Ignavibacteriaceae bacterium]